MSAPAPYRLDQLGWLQFERLCSLVLESGGGLQPSWHGSADDARAAWVEEPFELDAHGRVAAPALLAVVWVQEREALHERLIELALRVGALVGERGRRAEGRTVLLTNLDGERVRQTLVALEVAHARRIVVLGAAELG